MNIGSGQTGETGGVTTVKRILPLALAAALLLTGCGMNSPEDFYQLPKASEEYQSLERCLKAQLSSGLEYAAPIKGSNTQPVTVIDLNQDGVDEAVAFFRDPSGGENPLKIQLYRQDEAGEYYCFTTVEGQGNAINSVVFTQLDGAGNSPQELVVSWQVSTSVYALSAYSIAEDAAVQMMAPTNYSRYITADLDQNGISELVVLQLSASDTTTREAQYYVAKEGRMTEVAVVPLSQRMGTIDGVHTGMLSDGVPALFVTGSVETQEPGQVNPNYQVTDIITLRDGTFTSIAMDESGDSATLRYRLTSDQDLNQDGVWELPVPTLLANYRLEDSDTFYAVTWNNYASDGSKNRAFVTYYNSADGWYWYLPEEWLSKLSLRREDTTSGSTVERGVVFYYRAASDEEPQPIFAIYKNTGTNRNSYGVSDGRTYLGGDASAVYAVKLLEGAEALNLTTDVVASGFRLIQADWLEE